MNLSTRIASLLAFFRRRTAGASSTMNPSEETPDTSKPLSDLEKRHQRWQEIHKAQVDYCARNDIPQSIEHNERAIAVILMRGSPSADQLSKLGGTLGEWLATTNGTTRILGLDRLQSGLSPKVSPYLLGIPLIGSGKPEDFAEDGTALVVTKAQSHEDFLLDDIESILSQFDYTTVFTPSTYMQMMR